MTKNRTHARRAQQGLCQTCGKPPAPGRKTCDDCRVKGTEKQRRYALARCQGGLCACGAERTPGYLACEKCRTKRTTGRKERAAKGICQKCLSPAVKDHKHCRPCMDKLCCVVKNRIRALKARVIAHYGNKCSCCGESLFEFLSIEHKDGGGTKHRKELGGGSAVYRWIVRHDFPDNYTVLCFNCNCSKGFNGYCPHEFLRVAHYCG